MKEILPGGKMPMGHLERIPMKHGGVKSPPVASTSGNRPTKTTPTPFKSDRGGFKMK